MFFLPKGKGSLEKSIWWYSSRIRISPKRFYILYAQSATVVAKFTDFVEEKKLPFHTLLFYS